MPSFALDKLSALEVVARVENALMDGLPPPGQTSFGSHQGGVLRRAANELGTEANSVRGWVGTPSTRGRIERRFGIAVDWSLYGQAGKKVFVGISDDDAQAAFAAYRRHGTKYAAAGALGIGHHTLDRRLARAVELGLMPAATEEPPADPILVRRLRDENERLRAALKAEQPQRRIFAPECLVFSSCLQRRSASRPASSQIRRRKPPFCSYPICIGAKSSRCRRWTASTATISTSQGNGWRAGRAAGAALVLACALAATQSHAETVLASWYGHGRLTASGERFNPNGMTAAHRTFPFGARLRVCLSGCVTVRINDRGPFVRGRTLDLARGAAAVIGLTGRGVARVRMERSQ